MSVSTAPDLTEHISLNSWRGIAAVCVAIHHFPTNGAIANNRFMEGAYLFVDFFFVLSGFIMARNYSARLATGFPISTFMALRFARVYPLHLAALTLWLVSEIAVAIFGSRDGHVAFTGASDWRAIIPQIFLLQSLGLQFDMTWNFAAWSISTEFWTYLLFAIVITIDPVQAKVRFILVALASASYFLFAPPDAAIVRQWTSLLRCLYGFSAGVLVAAAFESIKRSSAVIARNGQVLPAFAEFAAVALLLVLLGTSDFHHRDPAYFRGPLVFAVVVLVFAFDAGPISRLLARPWLQWLGLISYRIYMVHLFIQIRLLRGLTRAAQNLTGLPMFSPKEQLDGSVIQAWGANTLQGDVATVMMLAMVLPVAWLSFRIIEMPARDGLRRLATQRRGLADPLPKAAPPSSSPEIATTSIANGSD